MRRCRSGRATLGVLLALPSIFASLVAQGQVGTAVTEHRHALGAGTDAARLAGQRYAEARNYVATVGHIATNQQATLTGLIGLVAAASTISPADAAAYTTRVGRTNSTLLQLGAAQHFALAEATQVVQDDLQDAARARGVAGFRLAPGQLADLVEKPAESCSRIFDPDAMLDGVVPSVKVEVISTGISARFLPWGPEAFAAAFPAALAQCAQGTLVPSLSLQQLPDQEKFVVLTERRGGVGISGFSVEQTGSSASPNFQVRLLSGPELAEVPGSDPYALLAP